MLRDRGSNTEQERGLAQVFQSYSPPFEPSFAFGTPSQITSSSKATAVAIFGCFLKSSDSKESFRYTFENSSCFAQRLFD